MTILFTICARAGSKGVKSKNARDFCGYPILYSTLSAFDLFRKRYGSGDDITLAINTDSDVVIDQASKTNVPHIIVRREESLAGDFAPKISVIADTLAKAEAMLGKQFDCVVDMDLTSPLRKVEDIHNIIEAAFSIPHAISHCQLQTREEIHTSTCLPSAMTVLSTLPFRQTMSHASRPLRYSMQMHPFMHINPHISGTMTALSCMQT